MVSIIHIMIIKINNNSSVDKSLDWSVSKICWSQEIQSEMGNLAKADDDGDEDNNSIDI